MTFANFADLQEAATSVGVSFHDFVTVPLREGRARVAWAQKRQTNSNIDRAADEVREAILKMVNEYLEEATLRGALTVITPDLVWDAPDHRRFAFFVAAKLWNAGPKA